MGMRRRPLARAAVVGGVAYHAGKKGAQNTAAEQAQNQQIADLQATAAVRTAAAAVRTAAAGAGRPRGRWRGHGHPAREPEEAARRGRADAGGIRHAEAEAAFSFVSGEESRMAIGPVQMLVLGFAEPNFTGKIAAELDRLREHEFVKIVDALVVNKDENGDITALQVSDLSPDEATEMGEIAGALIGFGYGARGGGRGRRRARRRGDGGRPPDPRGGRLVRRGRDPERHRRGDHPARAHLGDPAPRTRSSTPEASRSPTSGSTRRTSSRSASLPQPSSATSRAGGRGLRGHPGRLPSRSVRLPAS